MGKAVRKRLTAAAAAGDLRQRHRLRRCSNALSEPLEARWMLAASTSAPSGALAAALLSAVPAGDSAQFTTAGLALAASPAAGRVVTPAYQLLDPSPQLTAAGTLAPFASSSPVGLSPAQLRHAYGFDSISFGNVAGSGAGQTIAIIDAFDDPDIVADLATFDSTYDLPAPPSFTRVNETGGSSLPAAATASLTGSWAMEEALDVEWSHAMAPQANILLVEATSDDDFDMVETAVNYARSVPGVCVISMSWGEPEWEGELSEDSYFTTPANHSGITFLAATGDAAAPGNYPAFSPNVVAVGGTQLTTDSSGDYQGEIAWSESGGGISAYEPQPNYQGGIVTQSTTFRTTPDVAFDASPSSGVAVCDSYDFGGSTPWGQVGGTSLATPCWGALIAITDEFRDGGGRPFDGATQALPALYDLSSADFHDITSGSNGYAAGAGYDLVTGRGSPIAPQIFSSLIGDAPYVASASPSGAVTALPTSISFTFDQTMDTSSFSIASDVDSFTGPGGANDLSDITGYSWTSSTTLQLNLSLAAVQGTYSLTIGPNILATSGAPMDQNANGIAGETADTYTQTFIFDTTAAPAAPVLLASSDTGVSSSDGITGDNNASGKPLAFSVAGTVSGDTVQLLASGSVVGSAVASGTSTTLDVAAGTVLADGIYLFTAQQTPAGGGYPSTASSATSVTIDTAAPATPAAPLLQASSDTGISDSDGITSNLAPTFTVSVSTPYFRFYRNGVLLSGNYQTGSTFTLGTQSNGTFSYTVAAVDAAGNVSSMSPTTSVTYNTIAPPAPAAPVLQASSDTGSSNSDGITNDTTPVFNVTATQAGEVGVNVDGQPGGTTIVSGAGTYAVSAINAASRTFAAAAEYSAGSGPFGVIAADMNGNGLPDLVVPDDTSESISVLLNQGDGTFGSPIITSVSGYIPVEVAAGDFNGDGKMDLLVATGGSNVLLLLGNGNGTFQAPRVIATTGSQSIVVADFNHDGSLDFAVSNATSDSVSVYLGNGDGTFRPAITTAVGGAAYTLCEADFNNDKIPDLAVAVVGTTQQIQVLLGNGDGTFDTASTISGFSSIAGLAAGDFNGDGYADLVAVDTGNQDIALMLGGGNGSFAAPTDATMSVGDLSGIVVGDFNGDGHLDAATVSSGGYNAAGDICICYGNGSGTLASGVNFPVGENPLGLATADFNGDGKPDLVSANYHSDDVSVLLAAGGTLGAGSHSITAWAESTAGVVSTSSPATTITIDITPPTAQLAAAPAFTNGYVDTATITFSEAVSGLTKSNLSLTLDGGANLLDGTETLTTTDDIHWTIAGLGPLNVKVGPYVLSVNPGGITDVAGNGMTAAATASWSTVDPQPPPIVGSSTDTSFYIRADSTDRYVQVWKDATPAQSATPTWSYAASAAGPIVIDAGNATTAFTVDLTAGSVHESQILDIVAQSGGQNPLTVLMPSTGGALAVSDSAVTLSGAGAIAYSNLAAITIDGSASADTVTQQTVTGPPIAFVPNGGADVLNIDSGTYTLTAADGAAASLTVNDYSTFRVAAAAAGAGIFATALGALNLESGAGAAPLLASDSSSDRTVLALGSLSIASGCWLNLNNNDLIVHNGNYSAIESAVAQSADGGSWTGASGIGSATAAADPAHLHAIGTMANVNSTGAAIYTTFDGQPVVSTDVLLRYTLVGDANLDGSVNVADYALIDNGFNLKLAGWRNGDFNYDGAINGDDYSLIDNAFNEQNSMLAPALAASPLASDAATAAPPAIAPIDAIAASVDRLPAAAAVQPASISPPTRLATAGSAMASASNAATPAAFPTADPDDGLASQLDQWLNAGSAS